MKGNAAHGYRLAPFAIARGQSDLHLACGDDSVFVEELREIAQAEEHQGVWVALS